MVEGFTMKYTGKNTNDLALEIMEVLGQYRYMGIIKTTKTAFYVQETGRKQGVLYKDWENDESWVGKYAIIIITMILYSYFN